MQETLNINDLLSELYCSFTSERVEESITNWQLKQARDFILEDLTRFCDTSKIELPIVWLNQLRKLVVNKQVWGE